MSDVRTVKLRFSDLVFLEDNPRTITRENMNRLVERIKRDPTLEIKRNGQPYQNREKSGNGE